uniref:hypothetical protein n=1 Tax=Sphingomonas sp. TaxID=28214 RepID=UPI003B3ADCD4
LPWIAIEDPHRRFREGVGGVPWDYEQRERLAPGRALMFPGWLRHVVTEPALRIDLWPLLPAERP